MQPPKAGHTTAEDPGPAQSLKPLRVGALEFEPRSHFLGMRQMRVEYGFHGISPDAGYCTGLVAAHGWVLALLQTTIARSFSTRLHRLVPLKCIIKCTLHSGTAKDGFVTVIDPEGMDILEPDNRNIRVCAEIMKLDGLKGEPVCRPAGWIECWRQQKMARPVGELAWQL